MNPDNAEGNTASLSNTIQMGEEQLQPVTQSAPEEKKSYRFNLNL